MGKKLLIIAPTKSTFAIRDLKIFRKMLKLKASLITTDNKLIFMKNIVKLFNHDIYFIWFASGLHALIPLIISKILSKKTILNVGGHEVANLKLKNSKYGLGRRFPYNLIVKINFKLADFIIFVGEHLRDKAIKLDLINKKDIEKTMIIPTSVIFPTKCKRKKKNRVASTIVNNINRETGELKGLETFCKLAREVKDYKFKIIGDVKDEEYKNKLLERYNKNYNIEFLGKLGEKEVFDVLSESKIYCNFSYHEGIANSLLEAIYCNAFPLITDIKGNVEVLGRRYPFYITKRDSATLKSKFNELIKFIRKENPDFKKFWNINLKRFQPNTRARLLKKIL